VSGVRRIVCVRVMCGEYTKVHARADTTGWVRWFEWGRWVGWGRTWVKCMARESEVTG
jgi:hypothetical protein